MKSVTSSCSAVIMVKTKGHTYSNIVIHCSIHYFSKGHVKHWVYVPGMGTMGNKKDTACLKA